MNLETLTTFLGWCTLINFGLLLIFTFFLTAFRKPIERIHSKMFRIDTEVLPREYFLYLANFKIGVLIFNFVPWVALKIMGA